MNRIGQWNISTDYDPGCGSFRRQWQCTVRLIVVVEYRRTVSEPATRACNRPAFTRLASAWWRQADLSVLPTQLASLIGLPCSPGWLRRKVRRARATMFFFVHRVCTVPHVYMPRERFEHDAPRNRANLAIADFFFSCVHTRSINYLVHTHCFVDRTRRNCFPGGFSLYISRSLFTFQ